MELDDDALFAEVLGHMSAGEIEALAQLNLDESKVTAAKAAPKKKRISRTKASSTSTAKRDASAPVVGNLTHIDVSSPDDGDDVEELTPPAKSARRKDFTNLQDVFTGVVPADVWASGSAEMVSEALANVSIVNLIDHYGLPDTDLLMCLGKVTHLYLQGNGCIVDLSGISVLGSLRVLSVADNKVTSLQPLAFLDTLILLDAAHNHIEELDAEHDLPASLQSLDLRGNPCAPVGDGSEEDADYTLQYTEQLQTFCPRLRFVDGRELEVVAEEEETGFLRGTGNEAAADEMDPELIQMREEMSDGHVQSSAMARRQQQLLGELLTRSLPEGYVAPDRELDSGSDSDAEGAEASQRASVRDEADEYHQRCGRVREELEILRSHNGMAARLQLDNFWDSTMKSVEVLRGQVASRRAPQRLEKDGLNSTPPSSPQRGATRPPMTSEPSAMYKKAIELLTKEVGGGKRLDELRKKGA